MVYHTAINKTKPNNFVYGFCIAGTLGISVVTIGSITGAALNPWRVIPSAAITGELFTVDYNKYAWIYYLGNPLAGALMGLFWKLFFQVCEKKTPEVIHDDEEITVKLVDG